MNMKGKRGISEIITTVLMILLVLAAIAIIWVVLSNFLKSGTGEIEGATDCLTSQLIIMDAWTWSDVNGTRNLTVVKVERPQGTRSLDNILFYVGGILYNASSKSDTGPIKGSLRAGEYKEYNVFTPNDSPSTGKPIEVAAVFGEKECPKSDPLTIRFTS